MKVSPWRNITTLKASMLQLRGEMRPMTCIGPGMMYSGTPMPPMALMITTSVLPRMADCCWVR